MCVTRVGRVLSVNGTKAEVRFFDEGVAAGIDVSMVEAPKDAYLEIFANLALRRLTEKEARVRMREWSEIKKAAGAWR